MTTPDLQEKLKQEAKAIREKINALVKDQKSRDRVVRMVCIYAGMLTETLIEYEEPDLVMEQAFHRIAELLQCDPEDGPAEDCWVPHAYDLDHDTELGRHLARAVVDNLPKGMDDLHEIAIALVFTDFPVWEEEGFAREKLLRLLVEAVIASLTYEMATQDFCDLVIEDFIAEGEHTPAEAIVALAAVAGHLYAQAEFKTPLPDDAQQNFINVMVRESLRHGTPGKRNWKSLAPGNDIADSNIPAYIRAIQPEIDEFFNLVGLDDPMGRAVSVAKAVGRMIAVISLEDVGQIHPSIAKSLAKTGMILGARYREGVIAAV